MTAARSGTAAENGVQANDRPMRRFLLLGVVGLAAMLAGASALGLPPLAIVGATAALGAAVGVSAIGLRRRHPHARLGGANVITLLRLAMLAFLVSILIAGGGHATIVIAVSIVAVSLDGVDGYLARRQKLDSRFGAAFDMEVDSAFALVLALLAALGPAGPLAIVLGLPRYVFGAAGLAFPWLNGPLDERYSRKVVCVVQLIALIALQLPMLPAVLATGLVIATIGLLAWSFGVDIVGLARARAR